MLIVRQESLYQNKNLLYYNWYVSDNKCVYVIVCLPLQKLFVGWGRWNWSQKFHSCAIISQQWYFLLRSWWKTSHIFHRKCNKGMLLFICVFLNKDFTISINILFVVYALKKWELWVFHFPNPLRFMEIFNQEYVMVIVPEMFNVQKSLFLFWGISIGN